MMSRAFNLGIVKYFNYSIYLLGIMYSYHFKDWDMAFYTFFWMFMITFIVITVMERHIKKLNQKIEYKIKRLGYVESN